MSGRFASAALLHDPMRQASLVPRLLLTATAISAVAGFYGGLVRFGLALPAIESPTDLHGIIMMQGVFGTLIPLERAAALRHPAGFAAPILSAVATILMLANGPVAVAMAIYGLSTALFVCMSAYVLWLQRTAFNGVLLLGALSLLVAAGMLLAGDGETMRPLPWWLSFIVLTVAGERLELSRIMGHGQAVVLAFFVAAGFLVAGAALGLDAAGGAVCFSAGLALLALWFSRYDIALRTIRMQGQAQFMAAAILCGHFWLGIAGLLALGYPSGVTALDALIHAIAIGFALSMVMGHALVILPSVAGIRISYGRRLYLPLALLQVAVAWRVLADAFLIDLRWPSGLLVLLALAGFAVMVARLPRPLR